MKPSKLERKFTLVAEFYDLLLACLPLIFLVPVLARFWGSGATYLIASLVIIGALCWLFYRNKDFKQQLAEHETGLSVLANTNNWKLQTNWVALELPPELDNVSLLLIADRDRQVVNYLLTPDWNYIDLSYCVYQHTKNGDYKAAYVYYSVLVTKLPRVLPNVFFDSKSQGGRQYKAKFNKDQLHSMEGDFDTYFDTYFAEGYTIDSMSFITPDVMQALEEANNYDIEIIGDRLLMYGPVYLDVSEIKDGATKLQVILKSLQVTAKAYDDERLPGAVGRQTVTPEGFQLRRKSSKAWVTIIFVLAYFAMRLVIGLFNAQK